jgi:hypothetical protein
MSINIRPLRGWKWTGTVQENMSGCLEVDRCEVMVKREPHSPQS